MVIVLNGDALNILKLLLRWEAQIILCCMAESRLWRYCRPAGVTTIYRGTHNNHRHAPGVRPGHICEPRHLLNILLNSSINCQPCLNHSKIFTQIISLTSAVNHHGNVERENRTGS